MNSSLQFTKLMEPGKIGGMIIKNRMVMAPMATRFHSPEGYVTQRTKDYYEARARGGIGLIIVEATTIDSPEGKGFNDQLIIDDDRYIRGMKELTDVIHQYGAKAALQLHHIGSQGQSTITHHQLVAASAVLGQYREIPRPLTEPEIARLVTCYAKAAGRAKKAGFDGIEVHMAHGYLLCSFMNPLTNLRTDRYGGSTENRARFLVEILNAIREEVGKQHPLWCRIPSDLSLEFHSVLEKAGVDAIHISVPISRPDPAIPPMGESRGTLLPVAKALKKVASVPIIVVRQIDPILAENALREGMTDFVAFGRAVLAEPEYPNMIASDRLEDIKPCIRCNTCLYSVATRREGIHCAVNPALGREREYSITRAPEGKKLVVIGGGPAGMEAARVAALRGHKVILLEKNVELGGQLLLAQLPRYKQAIGELVSFLSGQLKKQGVEIRLRNQATIDSVTREAPDIVILAAGASPFIPDIPGIGKSNVILAGDVLTGNKEVGKRVVIIGGELVGCEVGDELAIAGKEVTITTLEKDLLTSDVLAIVRTSLKYRLDRMGVKVFAGVRYKEITEDYVLLSDNEGKEHSLNADTIILAAGTVPNSGLMLPLLEAGIEVYAVGDCTKPHNILDAMLTGYQAGLQL